MLAFGCLLLLLFRVRNFIKNDCVGKAINKPVFRESFPKFSNNWRKRANEIKICLHK